MRFVLSCIQFVSHVTIIINLWPVNIAYAVFRRFLSIESSIDVVQPSQHLLPQHNVDPRIENLVPGGKPYSKKIRRVVWNLLQRNVCYNSYLNWKKRKEIAFIIIALVCNFQFKRDWSWREPIFFYFKFYVSFLSALYRYFEWSAKIQMSRYIVDLQNYVIAMKNWTSLITILLNVVNVCLGFFYFWFIIKIVLNI